MEDLPARMFSQNRSTLGASGRTQPRPMMAMGSRGTDSLGTVGTDMAARHRLQGTEPPPEAQSPVSSPYMKTWVGDGPFKENSNMFRSKTGPRKPRAGNGRGTHPQLANRRNHSKASRPRP